MDLRIYLKDLPSGTTLYSIVSGEVKFKEIRKDVIVVLDHNHCEQLYHYSGKLRGSGMSGECLLFPSKELRDWDLFTKFKKGDIVVSNGCIAIVDHVGKFGSLNDVIYYQCCINHNGSFIVGIDVGVGRVIDCKYASAYDQERILRELKEHGFEIKGNTVVKRNKFDFDSLTEFDKVLVRDSNKQCWCGDFFQYMEGSRFVCTSSDWTYCIPYNDDTKHLIGTSMPAPEFYRK